MASRRVFSVPNARPAVRRREGPMPLDGPAPLGGASTGAGLR